MNPTATLTERDFKVADLTLAELGRKPDPGIHLSVHVVRKEPIGPPPFRLSSIKGDVSLREESLGVGGVGPRYRDANACAGADFLALDNEGDTD